MSLSTAAQYFEIPEQEVSVYHLKFVTQLGILSGSEVRFCKFGIMTPMKENL